MRRKNRETINNLSATHFSWISAKRCSQDIDLKSHFKHSFRPCFSTHCAVVSMWLVMLGLSAVTQTYPDTLAMCDLQLVFWAHGQACLTDSCPSLRFELQRMLLSKGSEGHMSLVRAHPQNRASAGEDMRGVRWECQQSDMTRGCAGRVESATPAEVPREGQQEVRWGPWQEPAGLRLTARWWHPRHGCAGWDGEESGDGGRQIR